MSHYKDSRLIRINWDEEEVPEGYVDLTFRIPDEGRPLSARTYADITLHTK